jgi:hypothetical protein
MRIDQRRRIEMGECFIDNQIATLEKELLNMSNTVQNNRNVAGIVKSHFLAAPDLAVLFNGAVQIGLFESMQRSRKRLLMQTPTN